MTVEDITPEGSRAPVVRDTTPLEPVNVGEIGPTVDEVRRRAYQEHTDGLFFSEQAGEVPPGTWVAARAALRAQFEETL